MKNIEPPSKEHLAAIITNLARGAYIIPDFQRDFEWSPGDVNDLIRSIFEDYYIGTLLLWRATRQNLDFLHCEPIYGYTATPKGGTHCARWSTAFKCPLLYNVCSRQEFP